MPLYEYECDACGHRFERIQKFSDPLADTCPTCGGHVHKLMSSPAIQFKGSGFYITDYAKKDHVASEKADRAASDSDKSEKSEKAEKSGETGKSDKTESPAKSDGGSSSSSSAPSASSSSTPSTSPSSAKDSSKSST